MGAAEFARQSGIGHRQVVHKYLRGLQFPSPENLLRIRQATGGAVTADDFVDEHAARRCALAPATASAEAA